MLSDFRELRQYFELTHEYGFLEFALQTVETNRHNTSREPSLERDEVIAEPVISPGSQRRAVSGQ
jgi:hypothetical protein